MQKYEWGGYTKISANGRGLSNDYGSGDVYSKFNYKKWTFDASVGGTGSHATRDRGSSEAIFHGVELRGESYDRIVRESSTRDYFSQSNAQWASVRAAYRKESLYAEHTVQFNRMATPTVRSHSAVEFAPRLFAGSQAMNLHSSQTLNPSVRGYYYIQLPKQNTLNISWSFDYGSTNSGSFYQLGSLTPIVNDNKEKVYSPTANVSYSKGLGHNNTFRMALMTFNTVYDTYYSGSREDHQKLLSSENMLFLEYMQNWKFGLSLYSRVGGSYVIGRVNGVNELEQFNPRLGFQLQYTINPKHRTSFEGWWGNGHPSASTSNGALTQSNELLWIQGNPDLRNVLFATLQGGYTFVPANKFSLSANVRYEGNPNKMAYEFRKLPGIDGLVRRLINSGDAHQYSAYIGANLTLFNKTLALHADGSLMRTVLTGCDAQSHTIPTGYAHARYQSNHWSVQLYYQTPGKSINAYTYGTLTRTPCVYGLVVNYAARNIKVALRSSNWFRTNGYATRYFSSPSYDLTSTNWSGAYSRNIDLTVSYTFTYGKKLNQNNELQKGGGVDSAILK